MDHTFGPSPASSAMATPNPAYKSHAQPQPLFELHRRAGCPLTYSDCGNGFCCMAGYACSTQNGQPKCQLGFFPPIPAVAGGNPIATTAAAAITSSAAAITSSAAAITSSAAAITSSAAAITSSAAAPLNSITAAPPSASAAPVNGESIFSGFVSSMEPTQTPGLSQPTNDSGDQVISAGAIAGIVIGVLLALGLIVGLVLIFMRRKRRTARDTPQPFSGTDTEMLQGPCAQEFPLQDSTHMQHPPTAADYPPDIKYGFVPETPNNVQQIHPAAELDSTQVSATTPIQRDSSLLRRKEIGNPTATHPARRVERARLGGGQGIRSFSRPLDRTEGRFEMP